MKYEVFDNNGGSISLEVDDGDSVTVIADDSRSTSLQFTKEQFKQLRRAIGYVWTELEGNE